MKILDDEEIKDVVAYMSQPHGHPTILRMVARKAEDKILEQVVEWGDENCPHYSKGENTYAKRACRMCWQELKKLAGGK